MARQPKVASNSSANGVEPIRPATLALLMALPLMVTSACARGGSSSSSPQDEIRTKNAAALASAGTIPTFHFASVSPAYALYKGKEHYKRKTSGGGRPDDFSTPNSLPNCPPLEAARRSSTKDEFEERDKERRIDAAIDECFHKFQPPSYPKLMAVRVPLPRNKYDFTAGAFELSFPQYVTKVQYLTYLSFEGDPMSVRLFPVLEGNSGTMDKHDEIVWSIESQFDGLVVLSGGTRGFFSYSGVTVACPEAAARELKAALERSPPSLDIAFEPRDFGRTGLTLEGPLGAEEKLGVRGRAVGYRLVHGDRVLVPWTPFGLNADGKDPAPSISL